MAAPDYKLNRTVTVQVPDGAWWGFNYPAITDAGSSVLFWGGVTYNQDEPGDPFYWNVVMVDKATFQVQSQVRINMNPANPYFTTAGVVVDGGIAYCMCWNWVSETIINNEIVAGPHGTYKMITVDLGTMAVVNRSNEVVVNGSQSIISSGGTEKDIIPFVFGNQVVCMAGLNGLLFLYDRTSNTLSIGGTGTDEIDGAAMQLSSNGEVYRLWVKVTGPFATDRLAYFDKCNLSDPTLTFTTPVLLPDVLSAVGGTANGTPSVYLDQANGLLYATAFMSDFTSKLLQISTADGTIVNSFDFPSSGQLFDAPPSAPWTGFFPFVAPSSSPDGEFKFSDALANITDEPNVTGPSVIYANTPILTGSISAWWDMLFLGPALPMYGNAITSDMITGQTVIFFEYTPGPVDILGGEGTGGYIDPEDAGLGLYQALDGFTASALERKSDSSVDNMDVTHFLDSDVISEADLRAGIYDFATVEVRVVNYKHPEHGAVKLLKGDLGRVSLKNGIATSELRGITQRLTTNIGSTYGPVCRAELFSGADGFPDYDPGNHWKCRKDPTTFTASLAVADSPDALTVTPTVAPTNPDLPTNVSQITLAGVAVNAAFAASTANGAFDLAYGGLPGNPVADSGGDRSGGDAIVATAIGNSLLFNWTGALYATFGTGNPMQWAVLSQAGTVVSQSTPYSDAIENWEMMVYGVFFVPAPGNYTFNILHDDGMYWAVEPTVAHPADLVTVVSGPVSPPQSFIPGTGDPRNKQRTAWNGYQFAGGVIAANNWSGSWSDSWTLNFPAAGLYNFEFDYTNWEHAGRLVVNVAGQSVIPPSDPFQGGISGWYDDGELTFTSGVLNGLSFDIQTFDGTSFKLFAGAPLPFQPQPGDTFEVRTGCNHLISDCYFKYNNVINFQAENQMPGQLILMDVPNLP